ncbi:helix-turn-helix domain-containing protein [Enterococcus casseliflavus]|jgi:transcriptional regulator with XRE-family HTH domain|uniref:helix-turn-helix domain-containing protein n=1 Tax=Enterococcus casseliflavus TaxID=37734 RepID=UPI003D10AABC
MNKETQNKLIAKRIKDLAKYNEISINKLAKEANLRQSTLNNIINEGKIPTVSTLLAICEATGITLSEFFDFAPYNKKEALLQASDR